MNLLRVFKENIWTLCYVNFFAEIKSEYGPVGANVMSIGACRTIIIACIVVFATSVIRYEYDAWRPSLAQSERDIRALC